MSEYPPPGQYGQGPYGQVPPPPGDYPPPGGQQYWQESPKRTGLAVTALVFGILALLTFWTVILTVLGVLFGLLAIVLGLIAMSKARRGAAGGSGMALTGVIMGFIGLIGSIVVGVLVWVVFKDTGGTDLIDCLRKAGNDQSKVEECKRQYTQRVDDQFSITITPQPTR